MWLFIMQERSMVHSNITACPVEDCACQSSSKMNLTIPTGMHWQQIRGFNCTVYAWLKLGQKLFPHFLTRICLLSFLTYQSKLQCSPSSSLPLTKCAKSSKSDLTSIYLSSAEPRAISWTALTRAGLLIL